MQTRCKPEERANSTLKERAMHGTKETVRKK